MTPLQIIEEALYKAEVPYYIEESEDQEEQTLYFSKSWDNEGYLMSLDFSHDVYIPCVD
jgi:hypothetical protein